MQEQRVMQEQGDQSFERNMELDADCGSGSGIGGPGNACSLFEQ
jgi:hypothetical protein